MPNTALPAATSAATDPNDQHTARHFRAPRGGADPADAEPYFEPRRLARDLQGGPGEAHRAQSSDERGTRSRGLSQALLRLSVELEEQTVAPDQLQDADLADSAAEQVLDVPDGEGLRLGDEASAARHQQQPGERDRVHGHAGGVAPRRSATICSARQASRTRASE